MAETLTSQAAQAKGGIGHNSRPEKIRAICAELDQMEKDRDEQNEKIRTFRKQKIKNELGIKLGDFDAFRRVYGMEDDRRDEYLTALKEGFDALDAGDQLDWLAATERHQERQAEDTVEESETDQSASGADDDDDAEAEGDDGEYTAEYLRSLDDEALEDVAVEVEFEEVDLPDGETLCDALIRHLGLEETAGTPEAAKFTQ